MKDYSEAKLTRHQTRYQNYTHKVRQISFSYSDKMISPRTLLKEIFDLVKDDEFENAVIHNQLISNDYQQLKKAMCKDESFATTKYHIYSKIMIGLSYRYLDIGRHVKYKCNLKDTSNDETANDSHAVNTTHTPEATKTQDNSTIEIWQINKSEDQQVACNIKVLLRTFAEICGNKLPAEDAVKQLLIPYNIISKYAEIEYENEIYHKETEYYGVGKVNKYLFVFLCNIIIRCLHNQKLSPKDIVEIYLTVLLGDYYDTYLTMYEAYKSDDNIDPLFASEKRRTLEDKRTKLCNEINDFINSIPPKIDNRTELIKRINIVCDELNQLTQYAVNNTGAFPHLTKDVYLHVIQSFENIIEILQETSPSL